MKNKFLLIAVFASSIAFASNTNISEKEVTEAQKKWAECIVEIGKASKETANSRALDCINTLYAYDDTGVLFKPTKATQKQFREDKESALSYFVKGKIEEDTGFALQPWSNVRFDNSKTIIDSDSAISMGNYYFTDANTNKEIKVEYIGLS